MGSPVPNTKKGKQAARRERVAAMRAQQRHAERRRNLITIGAIAAVAAVIIGGVAWYADSRGSASAEVIPPAVSGTTTVQAAAHQVPDTSGISGVAEYVTTGWPQASHNGPAAQALAHDHVTGPVTYSVTPPIGGQHNATWMNCGIYDKPVPAERAVHNMEHGAVWITYQPSLPQSEVDELRAFAQKQTMVPSAEGAASRYVDLSPYPGLSSPVVISSWGFQLKVSSPTDPRLQQFVSKFRASPKHTPEYGGACTGGVGTPLQK
jgi:Protein of unknown function (DUF3105)